MCWSFQIQTIFLEICVQDPDKMNKKRVELSIWNDILARIEQGKDEFDGIQLEWHLIVKSSTVFQLEFHIELASFSCWI